MATFLFASVPIQAHTMNPLPIAARLVERGHRVLWYSGRTFHDRIAAIGATPLPYVEAEDYSGHDIFEYFPEFIGMSGAKQIGLAFDRIFVGQAPHRVADLRAIIAAERNEGRSVDAMLTEGLSYGVGMVSELEGIPWATFADGPLPYADADTPPFGPGMLPMGGPIGRLRNRLVRTIAAKVIFKNAQRTYDAIRADLGLPRDLNSALDSVASPMLHMQGCTPSFEYPHADLPSHINWIGALKPDPTQGWIEPQWWSGLGTDGRRVIHVTQGSLRPDMSELVVPALRALAEENVRVVVTTGGPSRAAVETAYGQALPANCIVEQWIPYDEILNKADVFVTNGGYTGVTLALSHGVPIVQAGTTEEKAEIAARIQWSGVGLRLGKTGPAPEKVRVAVRRVLDEPGFRVAARKCRPRWQPTIRVPKLPICWRNWRAERSEGAADHIERRQGHPRATET